MYQIFIPEPTVRWHIYHVQPCNSQDLFSNSPLRLLCISFYITWENLALYQDNVLYPYHLSFGHCIWYYKEKLHADYF